MKPQASQLILRVALKAPLPELFDYLPPEDSSVTPVPGERVLVSFGRSQRTGIIAALADSTNIPADKLKTVSAIIDTTPVLDSPMVELLNWASSYYHHSPGEVYAAALPVLLRKGGPVQGPVEPRWSASETGRNALATLKAPVQKAVLTALLNSPEALNADALAEVHQGWQRAVRELGKKDFVIKTEVPVAAEQLSGTTHTKPQLNRHQQNAVAAIADTGFRTTLLEGVTGSGKTEVYLRLIEQQLDAGKQSLVIVPEIGLTPQLLERFAGRLNTRVTVIHSNLTDLQRMAAWMDARDGNSGVVVGTRSAIFTPLNKPGLIVIDEEHDASLKQQEGFRYSARDLAVMRGHLQDIPVVLGSATPSFESLGNADNGRYQHVLLPERAGGASQPSAHLIDLRLNPATDGLSQPMINAMRRHLDKDGQILIYLNRRGFAPTLFCSSCGNCVECRQCDARMVVHQKSQRIVCHHCGLEERVPDACPECQGELHPLGQGTERIESALENLFPDVPSVRLDRDSTRRKGSLESSLEAIRSGKARILLGTQMLTKGHDFPNVTMVGIIDADQGLFGTDFRSSERMAQNFVQVSGRAGRADRQGEVWIQTLYPEHELLQTLLTKGYTGFATQALSERKITMWPPFSHVALLRAECGKKDQLYQFLNAARDAAEQFSTPDIRLLGPAAAPMERRSGRWRAQILIHSSARPALHTMLTGWCHHLQNLSAANRVRWSVDVDPIELF